MDRRSFLKASVGSIGSLAVAGTGPAVSQSAPKPPNILFIMVDQLRYPSVFPRGVNNVDEFLARFMPNTHALWQRGVKFTQHFGASNACGPSRGVIHTGLYSQQTWILQTLTNGPNAKFSVSPALSPVFPTYGRLLRQAGYRTPYVGKWHLSVMRTTKNPLQPYGFEGLTDPDPTGANLQGAVGDEANGFLNDAQIASQAARWLRARRDGEDPWCLTVSLINPHDHEFFWGGTEFQTFNNLFNGQSTYQPFTYYSMNNGTEYPPVVAWEDNTLKNPPSYGYRALPPNWESAARLAARKPTTHTFLSVFNSFVWGGITFDRSQTGFSIEPYPSMSGYGYGLAPFSYWKRNLDCYTQTMRMVDRQIGRVVGAMTPEVAQNTVIVFVSDHGDYAGAHGLALNKAATAYDEAFHVPLIVVDPTEKFAGDVGIPRNKLTSSVDLFNLLVSLGHNGSQEWLTGAYQKMYGGRHNMMPMLKSAGARGRPYVLFATDEIVQPAYNFNQAPLHVLGMRSRNEKIATYSDWRDFTTRIAPASTQVEYYSYDTEEGRAELDNQPNIPRAARLANRLHDTLLPEELQARLPGIYGEAQNQARIDYLQFAHLIQNPPSGGNRPEIVKKWLGFGQDF